LKVLLVGFGTVGQGVAEVISLRKKFFVDNYGEEVKAIGVIDSRSAEVDAAGLDLEALVERKKATGAVGAKPARSAVDLIRDLEYDVLIETSPTNVDDAEPGLSHIKAALGAGKDVITSNKGPLALRFRELSDLAERNGATLRFEGAVGGAMPIINLSSELLQGEEIISLRGILNGTCNFILNRMKDEGLTFEQALKEAQDLGYAERDPTYDIDGVDSAAKLAILANAVFGMNVTYHDVVRTGIRQVTEEAISLAAERRMVIRLIGEIGEGKLEVAPRMVPAGHPLAIGGTLNIVQLITDLAGDVTVAGRGAGRKETASAVLSDIIAILGERRE